MVDKKVENFLKRGPRTKEEIAELFGLSSGQFKRTIMDMRKEGINVVFNPENGLYYVCKTPTQVLEPHVSDVKGLEKVIGLCSDTHLCDVGERVDFLEDFYHKCEDAGVQEMFHAGDIVDGQGVYRGQENHLKAWGAKAQAEYAIKNYPKSDKFKTHFITGNHDLSTFNKAGVDVGELIAAARPDMIYLGQYSRDVDLGNGCTLRVIHPDGGGAYAKSYKAQVYIRNLQGGTKPNIIEMGHWHDSVYLIDRNIHTFMAGCFMEQSDYMARKGLHANMGGWIVKLEIGDRGSVRRIQPEWVAYYK